DHYAELPVVALSSARAVVLMGELDGARSPARAYSRMVGADIIAGNDGDVNVPLTPAFEHALLPIEGNVALGARPGVSNTLLPRYRPPRRDPDGEKGDSSAATRRRA